MSIPAPGETIFKLWASGEILKNGLRWPYHDITAYAKRLKKEIASRDQEEKISLYSKSMVQI